MQLINSDDYMVLSNTIQINYNLYFLTKINSSYKKNHTFVINVRPWYALMHYCGYCNIDYLSMWVKLLGQPPNPI